MTSKRKHSKQAARLGLSDRELRLAELLEEMLQALRWMQILGYSNQYLISNHLQVDAAERDKILEAATRAVDRDAKLHEWAERLAAIKGEAISAERRVERARREPERGHAARTSHADDTAG